MNDCIFCQIIDKKSPANIVYEDSKNLAFLELNQSSPGHVMVILKKHGRTLWDYDEKEVGSLMVGVQTVSRKVKTGMNCDWLSIGINHEEKRGVAHLHVHIIPRYEGDGGKVMQGLVNNPSHESREVIAEKIKKA